MGKRIAFTGGSGVVGRTVVPYLVERGHKVLNLDLKPLDAPGVNAWRRPAGPVLRREGFFLNVTPSW